MTEESVFAGALSLCPEERGAFLEQACAGRPQLREAVEALLAAHEKPHNVLDRRPADLGQIVDSEPVETDHSTPGERATDLPHVPGYQVLGEIARGGMGKVLAAFDLGLDRDVAVKILLPGANADRFVRESKITARLPHPGIPPVHALGTLADGSPFLAMKLIAGQTLAAEMKTADRPRLLQVFTQVCQAVGFAHSRGVIHRDLKPANVMVGAFGEVQVMDWGLAKELTSREAVNQPRAAEVQTAPIVGTDANQTTDHHAPGESTADRTKAGAVMGTPAYMAPEQARGEATDARSDVFALGGILCAILTGQPPYRGKSPLEIIQRAGAGDLAEAYARLDGCGADAELVALCRCCLSPNPVDRPANGQVVADGLSAYLNGVQERLQAAQRERAVALAREAEQRKRRKVQLALAATVLLAVLGGSAGAGIYLMQAQKVRSDEALRGGRNVEAVAGLLDQAKMALQAGDAAKAKTLFDAAGERMNEGGADDLSGRRDRLRADLAVLIELDKVDQIRWIMFPDRAVVAARFREVLVGFGLQSESMPAQEASARVSGSAVRDRLVAALDHWMSVEKLPWVRAVLQGADPHPYRDAVRDAFLAQDGEALGELASRPQAAEQPPGFVAFLCERGAMTFERRRELLAAAVRQRPDDLGLLMALGITSPPNEKNGAGEKLRWFQAAVGVAPRNGAAHNSLGLALYDAGRKDEALATFEKATEFAPNYAGTHINLGNALAQKGRYDEAIVTYRKALAIEPENASTHANLSNVLRAKGQVADALASLRKASEYAPKDPLFHYTLGDQFRSMGQTDEAIACLRKAIELEPGYARAYEGLGEALQAKDRLDEAMTSYEKAIELDPKLVRAHVNLGMALITKGKVNEAVAICRKAVELAPKLSEAHNNLGLALIQKGEVAEATACWEKAIELDPKNASPHNNLGEVLRTKGQVDEAITLIRKAIELAPKEAKPHASLGLALVDKGRPDEAIASYKKAIELDPRFAGAHNNLGLLLLQKGQVDEAIACCKKAVELEPTDARAHAILGEALKGKGQVDEAIASFEKALSLDPDFFPARHSLAILHFNNGNGYRGSGKVDEAIASYKKALSLDPKFANAHTGLGAILADKGEMNEAIACFKKAVELEPKNSMAYYNLGRALVATGQVDQAIACCRKATQLDPGNIGAHIALGALLASKGQMDESIVSSRRAIELDPKNAEALCNLGRALRSQGQFAEALDALRRGHELGTKKSGWRYPSAEWVRQAEADAALEAKLPGFLEGKFRPGDNKERLSLAGVCQAKKLYRSAAGLYAAAFADDPKLADDRKAGHRYNAACDAALAAVGQGEDAGKLDDEAKEKLRGQARDWLKADLTILGKLLASGPPQARPFIVRTLSHWQKDADLAGIRDAAALAKLPAEEQKALAQLWADVAALLKKAGEHAK